MTWPEAVDEALCVGWIDEEMAFRRRKAAWAFFENQAPSYRKTMLWRI